MHEYGSSEKVTKQDGNAITILLHDPYILCHFANQLVDRRVISYTEGCRKSSTGCVVHVDVHRKTELCCKQQCNLLLQSMKICTVLYMCVTDGQGLLQVIPSQ